MCDAAAKSLAAALPIFELSAKFSLSLFFFFSLYHSVSLSISLPASEATASGSWARWKWKEVESRARPSTSAVSPCNLPRLFFLSLSLSLICVLKLATLVALAYYFSRDRVASPNSNTTNHPPPISLPPPLPPCSVFCVLVRATRHQTRDSDNPKKRVAAPT